MCVSERERARECVCVSMCVSGSVSVYESVFVCLYLCLSVLCVCVCMCVCVCVRGHAPMCVAMHARVKERVHLTVYGCTHGGVRADRHFTHTRMKVGSNGDFPNHTPIRTNSSVLILH